MTAERHGRSGGELVAAALKRHGTKRVFCVPGESYLEVLDALYDLQGAVSVVTCRHEGGAAVMAEADAKLSGRPGVCMVTRGPGACNAAIGVHTAFQDSTPMVLLVGQVARPHLGREAFQEVDFERFFAPLAKWAVQADDIAALPELMAEAMHRAASGRPGPVVVALPEDLLRERSDVGDAEPRPTAQTVPAQADMARLRALLAAAERPAMLIGGSGWSARARDSLAAFVDRWQMPVACSFRRHDVLDNDHRCFAGEMGIAPNPRLVERIKAADVLLIAGARVGEMTSQGYTLVDIPDPKGTVIHVHASAEEPGRVFRPTLGICAGMEAFFAAARDLDPPRPPHPWGQWTASARSDYEDWQARVPGGTPLDLGAVMEALAERMGPGSVLSVDAGNFSGWPQRFLRYGPERRLLGPTSGAMGYAIPAAVAASLAGPAGPVVACVGDGGAMMTGAELATAVQHGAKPVVLVFDNGMYGTIRMHQERRHPGRAIATGLANPDFAALARACGAFGETVERSEDFAPALDRALAAGRAALLHLKMDPEQITTRNRLSEITGAAR